MFFLLAGSSFHLGMSEQCNLLHVSTLLPCAVGQQLDVLDRVEISCEAVLATASTPHSPSDSSLVVLAS